ncbi:hypothetical protein [Shimia sp. SDUM112013]|uniref:hypothetical protein n=1 Tax=Shimia sp. SDUM112013 TaxID=3136160 RepID=UPI0032EB2607
MSETGADDKAQGDTASWAVSLVVLAAVAVAIAFSMWPAKRSFAISVETTGLTLTPDRALSGDWFLPEAELCLRKSSENRDVQSVQRSTRCNTRFYHSVIVTDAFFDIAPGATLEVSREPERGDLQIFVASDATGETRLGDHGDLEKALIFLPAHTRETVQSLPFSGMAVLGAIPRSGEKTLVKQGRYEVRENSLVQQRPMTVARGDFFLGDRISITDGESPNPRAAVGFMLWASAGLDVQLYTPPAHDFIKVERLGTEPTLLNANAIDRLLANPIPVLASVVFALLASSFDLASRLLRQFSVKQTAARRRR